MSENATVKYKIEQEAEKEVSKARERALKKAKERNAVSEGFKTHTKGEKLFNDITYTGLGYFGVTGLSVFMTWLLKDKDKPVFGMKEPLKNHFERAVNSLSTQPMMNPKRANSILTIGTLFVGGSLMTITFVKWFEDNKSKIVKWFDKNIFYGKDAVEHDPELIEAHKIIDSQPKQTWASVGGSRAVAFLATISTWLLIGENSGWLSKRLGTSLDTMGTQFGRWSGRLLNTGNKKAIEKIDEAIQINRTITEFDAPKGLKTTGHSNMRDLVRGVDTPWTRILSYTGMDGLYTVITSVGLFISTRVLGPVFDKQGTEKLTAAAYEKELPKSTQPAVSLTTPAQREDEPKLPRVKVENVESIERLSTHAAEQSVLRPTN
ncbi:MAG: hypothetical protein ACOYJ2_05225 [Rickettsiales bacterium]